MNQKTIYSLRDKKERERIIKLVNENKPKHESNIDFANKIKKEYGFDFLKYIILNKQDCTTTGNREWIETELWSVIENDNGKQFNFRAFLGIVTTNIILNYEPCEKAYTLHSSKITELLKNNNVNKYEIREVLSEKSTTQVKASYI